MILYTPLNKRQTNLIRLVTLVTISLSLCVSSHASHFCSAQGPISTVYAQQNKNGLVLYAGLENGTISFYPQSRNDKKMTQLSNISDKHVVAPVSAMSSCDETHLFSCSFDQTFRIWDICKKKSLFVSKGFPYASINSIGKLLFVSTNDVVQMWDWENQFRIRNFTIFDKTEIKALHFSENSQYLFAGSKGGSICVWDLTQGSNKPYRKIKTNGSAVDALLCQKGKLFAGILSGNKHTYIQAWEWRSKNMPLSFQPHYAGANVMCLSKKKSCVYAGLSNRSVQKYEAAKSPETIIPANTNLKSPIVSMCYQNNKWFFSTKSSNHIFYIEKEKKSGFYLFSPSTWVSSKEDTTPEVTEKKRIPEAHLINQLNAAQKGYVFQKQMLENFSTFTEHEFLGTNPKVIENFTKEKLEEEWCEAIKLADRKKIEALLDNQNLNPSIQKNHPDFDLIQCTDKRNCNVLHYAVSKGNYPLVQDLFKNYKKRITPLLNNPNKKGLSPMDIAYEKNCMSILKCLYQNNAKLIKYATATSNTPNNTNNLNLL